MPLHQLDAMPLAHLNLYRQYTARRGFPARRIEQLLAQIPLVLAHLKGDQRLTLRDFLFDPREPDPAADAAQRQRDMQDFFKD